MYMNVYHIFISIHLFFCNTIYTYLLKCVDIYIYRSRCLLKATTEGPALHSLLLAAELQDATFPAAALLTRLRKSAKEVSC